MQNVLVSKHIYHRKLKVRGPGSERGSASLKQHAKRGGGQGTHTITIHHSVAAIVPGPRQQYRYGNNNTGTSTGIALLVQIALRGYGDSTTSAGMRLDSARNATSIPLLVQMPPLLELILVHILVTGHCHG